MTRRRTSAPAAAAALVLLTMACSTLDAIEPDQCGNGVVEPALGEDCDRPGADCGAPATAHACRLLCTTAADCPAAATCGRDGTCVVPDGHFTQADEQAINAQYLLVGDLDGAGDPDLIAIDDVRIDARAGTAGAGFDAAALLPNQPMLVAPIAGDYDDDGRTDVVTSVGFALDLVLGDRAEFLAPTVQPTITTTEIRGPLRAARFRYADGGHRGLTTGLVVTLPPGPDCGAPAGCPIVTINGDGVALNPGRAPARLVDAELPWAWVPTPPGIDPSFAVVALPFTDGPGLDDSSAVDVYRLAVVPGAGPSVVPLGSITNQAARTAAVGDVDGDGRIDVIIESQLLGGRTEQRVARGTATGFEAPRRLQLHAVGAPTPVDAPPAVAWLDVNGDRVADLVTGDAVLGLTCPSPTLADRWDCEARPLAEVPSFSDTWVRATQGDVNGDGRLDLIAVRSNLTTVDVFLAGRGLDSLTAAPFVVAAPVTTAWCGDFDGNGADDVAMLTGTNDSGRVDLRIAFGVVGGVPGPPVRTGTMTRPAAIGVENIALSEAPADGADDLILYDERPDGVGLTILFGSASQRLSAPLYPAAEPLAPADSLLAIPALVTVPLDGPDVVAALAVQLTPRVAQLPVIHSASVRFFSASHAGLLTEQRGGAIDLATFGLLGARVAVVARAGEAPRLVAVDDAGHGLVVSITGCPGSCGLGDATALGGNGDLGAAIAVAALTTDDRGPGVVALTATDATTEALIWHDLTAPPERVRMPDGVVPVTVTAIAAPGGGPRPLVFGTLADGVLVSLPGADGRYQPPVDAVVAGVLDQGVRAGLAVSAVDVDGDHVEDLVVGVGPDGDRLRQVVTYTQGYVPGGAGLAAGEGQ